MKTRKLVTIFSGYNQRAVIAFIRTLDADRVKYAIIASSDNDPIFLTSYAEKVQITRQSKTLDLNDISRCLKYIIKVSQVDELLIAPTTESLNRFLLRHKRHFDKINCVIPLIPENLYKEISDKYSFSNLCTQNNILVPMEFKSIDDVVIPYVAKPKQYYSKAKESLSPVLIFTQSQHNKFINTYLVNDFYYQEYIKGTSYYLLYYFYKDGKCIKFSQRNVIQQPQGKHIVAALPSNFHLSNESSKYEKLFMKVHFYGLVMVEVKTKCNRNYMIEANPRFWGPSQLFVDCNINLFEHLLLDYSILDKICTTPPKYNIRYYWHAGIVETELNKQKNKYYNTTRENYTKELNVWLSHDIYNRPDTQNLYLNEITTIKSQINK